jgi:hypothetical protein
MQMDEVTQQNAALVEEAAAASKSMEDQAAKMVELMGFFKTGTLTGAATSAPSRSSVARATGNSQAGGGAAPVKAAGKPAPQARGCGSGTGEWTEF